MNLLTVCLLVASFVPFAKALPHSLVFQQCGEPLFICAPVLGCVPILSDSQPSTFMYPRASMTPTPSPTVSSSPFPFYISYSSGFGTEEEKSSPFVSPSPNDVASPLPRPLPSMVWPWAMNDFERVAFRDHTKYLEKVPPLIDFE